MTEVPCGHRRIHYSFLVNICDNISRTGTQKIVEKGKN